MSKIDEVKQAVRKGQMKKIEAFVQEALDEGAKPMEIIGAMTSTMGEVGERFQKKEMFVPEMLASALTMKKGVTVLKPLLSGDSVTSLGKFIIGTVEGDLHDIGKNLVALLVESAGFDVIDLGVDVPAEKFLAAIQANPDCKVVGLSALLTTTMAAMEATIHSIKAAGLPVKVMIGGAPITPAWAQTVGADAYTADAAEAAKVAKAFVS